MQKHYLADQDVRHASIKKKQTLKPETLEVKKRESIIVCVAYIASNIGFVSIVDALLPNTDAAINAVPTEDSHTTNGDSTKCKKKNERKE